MKKIRRIDRIGIANMLTQKILCFDKEVFAFRNGDVSINKLENKFKGVAKDIRSVIKIAKGKG